MASQADRPSEKPWFYIAIGHQICSKCDGETRVVGFAVPYVGEDAIRFIPRLECTPFELRQYLDSLGLNFKPERNEMTGYYQLNNCCEHCGAVQDDFYLFDEPNGVFCPMYNPIKDLEFLRVSLEWPIEEQPGFENADYEAAVDEDERDWYILEYPDKIEYEWYTYAQGHHQTVKLDIADKLRYPRWHD